MITGLPAPYADVAYADGINLSSAWTTATDPVKEAALQWARVYIDKNYICYFDEDAPSDLVKTANSLLAAEHIGTPLFDTVKNGQPQKGLTQNLVDADGVKVQKNWDPNFANAWVDPFPEITALLAIEGDCRLNQGSIQVVPLLRR